MSRRSRFAPVLVLIVTGCLPTSVDPGELRSAAAARQPTSPSRTAALRRDVSALLDQPLTADSAAQIAVLNNSGLRASLEELSALQASAAGVRRLPNPSVEAAMRFHGSNDPEIEIGAMIDVTELVLVLSRGGAAQASVDAEKLAAVGAIVDLSYQVRQAFFEYQALLQALELRRSAMLAFTLASDVAERLLDAGNITALQRAHEQSMLEEARLSFQRAETLAASAREELNAAMGLWGPGSEWRTQGRLPDLPEEELSIETLEADAVRKSLDLDIARQRFSAAAKRANVATASGFLPELKAGVSAELDDEWAVGPAVELEVPLFYQGQAETSAAKAEMRSQQHSYTDAAIRLRSRARQAATRLRAARAAVAYYRDVLLPLKQKILDETQLQYNAMAVGVFQLLQAKRDQVETESAYTDQLREYWVARMRAEQLLAGRMGETFSASAPLGSGASRTGRGVSAGH